MKIEIPGEIEDKILVESLKFCYKSSKLADPALAEAANLLLLDWYLNPSEANAWVKESKKIVGEEAPNGN